MNIKSHFTKTGKLTLMLAVVLILSACLFIPWNSLSASTDQDKILESLEELHELEKKGEAGDTVAIHRLIKYYDELRKKNERLSDFVSDSKENYDEDEVNEPHEKSCEYEKIMDYWIDRGCAFGDLWSMYVKGENAYESNYFIGLPLLFKAADAGSGDAMLSAGWYCRFLYNHFWDIEMQEQYYPEYKGIYTEDLLKELALKYFFMAYDAKVPGAAWALGYIYDHGDIVEYDEDKAMYYYRQGALEGDEMAIDEVREYEERQKWLETEGDSE